MPAATQLHTSIDQQHLQTFALIMSLFCLKGEYNVLFSLLSIFLFFLAMSLSAYCCHRTLWLHVWVSSHSHLIRQNKTGPHRKSWGSPVLRGVAWKEASLKWLFWLVSECILEWKALIITHCYIQRWLTSNPHSLHRYNTYINVEFGKLAKWAGH